MRWAAFIPARGGSTRIPRKNLARVGNASLVERAIRCAVAAGIEEIVVSTDDREIADEAVGAAPVAVRHRSAAASSSTAQIEDAIAEWWDSLPDTARPDGIVLLQPTSPFRRPETIRACMAAVEIGGNGSAFTVTRTHPREFHGEMVVRGDGSVLWTGTRRSRPRTQDCAPYAYENGCVYAFDRETWETLRSRHANPEDSHAVAIDMIESIDIDTLEDLEMARKLAAVASW